MTDIFKDDETGKAHQRNNFKDKILADLEAASRERIKRLAEEERLRQERLAEAAKKQEEAELILRLAREEAERAERDRLEAERLAKEAEEARRRQAEEAEEALRLAREKSEREKEAAQRLAQEEAQRAEQERLNAEAQQAEQLRREAAELEAARRAEQERREAERADHDRLEAEARRLEEYEAYVAEQERLEAARRAEQERLTTPLEQVEVAQTSSLEETKAFTLGELTGVTSSIKPIDFDHLTVQQDATASLPIFEEEDDPYLQPVAPEHIGLGKKDKKNHLAKKISLIVASALLILLLSGVTIGALYVSSAIKPLDKEATEFVQVEIPEGSGNRLIGQVLEEAGIIKSGTVFNYYTKFKNFTGFQSGYYNFKKSMSLDDIAKLLQEGGTPEPVLPALGKIVIPEGYTLRQIAQAVTVNGASDDKTAKTPFKEEDFLKVVKDPAFIARMAEKYPNLLSNLPEASLVKYQLEGYLFPATYSYYESSTVESLAEEMLAAMDTKLSPYYGQIAERGMTVNQILSMAALVEKEGSTDDDRRQIASVFYNRMAIDMPLQSNIAILYAMDKLGDRTTLAEDAAIDTEIDSPYNIYTQPGLTPGPVDSPSLSAIEASITPAKTDYLYFVADVTTGAVYYAETFDDHNINVEKYVNSHLE